MPTDLILVKVIVNHNVDSINVDATVPLAPDCWDQLVFEFFKKKTLWLTLLMLPELPVLPGAGSGNGRI